MPKQLRKTYWQDFLTSKNLIGPVMEDITERKLPPAPAQRPMNAVELRKIQAAIGLSDPRFAQYCKEVFSEMPVIEVLMQLKTATPAVKRTVREEFQAWLKRKI